jgi:hypothetical protein
MIAEVPVTSPIFIPVEKNGPFPASIVLMFLMTGNKPPSPADV